MYVNRKRPELSGAPIDELRSDISIGRDELGPFQRTTPVVPITHFWGGSPRLSTGGVIPPVSELIASLEKTSTARRRVDGRGATDAFMRVFPRAPGCSVGTRPPPTVSPIQRTAQTSLAPNLKPHHPLSVRSVDRDDVAASEYPRGSLRASKKKKKI